ncbi:MAG: ATP synthase F0 subunit B, partial [Candidatus Roizmanbacteria bacterium]|nr:ATP synthase F0 subunit B [Candidatus Roizmanbacteria bacterium]
DIKLLIAQLINFGLFFFIYKKFIAGPFVSVMKGEKMKDANRKKMNEEVEKQREVLALQEKASKEEIHKKTEESLKAVRHAAELERVSLLAKAEEESKEIVKRASKQIEEERHAMEKQYKETLAKVSVMTVEHVLKDFLTEDMQKQVNAKVLSNLAKK